MTIKLKTGNILDAEENLICQQVNHQGKMSAGLALQIRNKYPRIYDSYCNFIKENKDYNEIKFRGLCHYFLINEYSKYIVNIFGQQYYGNQKNYTDYVALQCALYNVKHDAKKFNFSIAIPYKMSCNLAGGSWEIVYKIIQDIFENNEVKVVIYKLEGVE